MAATHPVIHLTLLFAGLCAILQCVLTALVIRRRIRARVELMDGGDKPLQRRVRAHGNFTETVPMALILLALLELRSLPTAWLWTLGSALIAGRVFHALGVLATDLRWARLVGMTFTLAVLSIAGVLCIYTFWRG